MKREQTIAEIEKRSSFPFDFARASDAELKEMLDDLRDSAAGESHRFADFEPRPVARG